MPSRPKTKPPPRLADERQKSILEAAVEEFSSKGFEAASTNAIAARAKVAKGLLFHYFGSKEELYLAAFGFAYRELLRLFFAAVGPSPRDLFERLRHWTLIRLGLAQRHPALFRLAVEAYTNTPPGLRSKLLELLGPFQQEAWAKLLEGIDFSPLRPDITPQQALEVLMIFQAGLERRYLPLFTNAPDGGLSQLEQVTKEAGLYLDLVRDALYRR
jgi:TetR/AcrR family transcriptional regulator